MKRGTDRKTEPKRTIRHTERGGHSVDARDILQSKRAQELISEVAEKLTVWREDSSHPHGKTTES